MRYLAGRAGLLDREEAADGELADDEEDEEDDAEEEDEEELKIEKL